MASTDDGRGTHEIGAVAAEYGVLLGFIVLAVAIGVGLFGQNLAAFIGRLASDIARYLAVG